MRSFSINTRAQQQNSQDSSSLFQIAPYNFKTLKSRLDQVSSSNAKTIEQYVEEANDQKNKNTNFYGQVVVDAIQSCRKLQQKLSAQEHTKATVTKVDNAEIDEIMSSEDAKADSKAASATSKSLEVEHLLEDFLLRNDNPQINAAIVNDHENILRSYLLAHPIPSSHQVLNVITELNQKLGNKVLLGSDKSENSGLSVTGDNDIKIALRVILNNEKSSPVDNFKNAFKLIDTTFGSAQYINSIKKKIFAKYVPGYILGFISVEIVAGFLFDQFAVDVIGISPSSTTGLKLMLGSYLFNVSLLGIIALLGFFSSRTSRVKWRSGVTLWYKYLHRKELASYEKLFINYEELYELNVNNYHLIGGNRGGQVGRTGPQVLLPGAAVATEQEEGIKSLLNYSDPSNDKVSYDFSEASGNGADNNSNTNELHLQILSEKQELLRFFRENLRKKRMVIEEYTEPEILFQEYWASNGENFEWVEPDQDPAELKVLAKYKMNQ